MLGLKGDKHRRYLDIHFSGIWVTKRDNQIMSNIKCFQISSHKHKLIIFDSETFKIHLKQVSRTSRSKTILKMKHFQQYM